MDGVRKRLQRGIISVFISAALIASDAAAASAGSTGRGGSAGGYGEKEGDGILWHLGQIGLEGYENAAPDIPDIPVAAVIDTGVQTSHPALCGSLWVNEAERDGEEGVDDDGNGYVDDVHGYNVRSDSGNVEDTDGHGTHVAGILAMRPTEESSARGVAPAARIMVVKAGNSTNGFSSGNVVRGIRYAVENGADVINLSLGTGYCTDEMREAIAWAAERAVVVAAAGNLSSPTSESPGDGGENMFPAGLPEVIGVMSSDRSRQLAWFSNWDRKPDSEVDYEIIAPGEDIYSTSLENQYRTESGTSMSAAIVSGACCLLVAEWRRLQTEADMPPLQPERIRECVVLGAGEPIAYTDDTGMTYEFPSLNIASAMQYLHSQYAPGGLGTAKPPETAMPSSTAIPTSTPVQTPKPTQKPLETVMPLKTAIPPETVIPSSTAIPTSTPVQTPKPTQKPQETVMPPEAAMPPETPGAVKTPGKETKIQNRKAIIRKRCLSKKKMRLRFSVRGLSPDGWYLYRAERKKGKFRRVKKWKKQKMVLKKKNCYYYVRAYKKEKGKTYLSKRSEVIRW